MEYSYFLKTSIEYDKKRLWFYIDALISPMFDAYQSLHRLAVGKVFQGFERLIIEHFSKSRWQLLMVTKKMSSILIMDQAG